MAKLVSKVYGDALFDLGTEERELEQLKEEAVLIREALRENPELTGLMTHPEMVREEKVRLLENCFGRDLSRDMTGFLAVVTEKGRFRELPAILEYFLARVKEYQGIGTARVCSAVELSSTWKQRVEEKLLATTGYRSMETTYQVDESLLGGLVIQIGDRVVDTSLKYRLDRMKGQLLKISLELEKEGGHSA